MKDKFIEYVLAGEPEDLNGDPYFARDIERYILTHGVSTHSGEDEEGRFELLFQIRFQEFTIKADGYGSANLLWDTIEAVSSQILLDGTTSNKTLDTMEIINQ